MEYQTITSTDGETLYLKIYNIENPKGCVQIVHGMQEHQTRYENFAKFLNANGYACVTSDLRGHGENAKELGFFKETKGYEALISDQVEISKYIKKELKIDNLIIYGHSMGSIITRNVIFKNSELYSKVVLSGFPNYNKLAFMAIFFSNCAKTFKGKHKYSKFLHNITLGPFEKASKDGDKLSWLTLSKENVENYKKDKLCGVEFTNSAYNDLHHLLHKIGRKNKYKDMVTPTPILLLYGSDDPVVGGIKGVKLSKKLLNKQGFNDLKEIEYKNLRHELLNEDIKEDIYNDFLNFINM